MQEKLATSGSTHETVQYFLANLLTVIQKPSWYSEVKRRHPLICHDVSVIVNTRAKLVKISFFQSFDKYIESDNIASGRTYYIIKVRNEKYHK